MKKNEKEEVKDEIAQEILNLYSLLPLNGKPLLSNQYTILSGIIAQIKLPHLSLHSTYNSNSNSTTISPSDSITHTTTTLITNNTLNNEKNYLLLPISLTTGTKCLSNTSPGYQQGITLSDSHAEVLARRSLIRYLLLFAIEILKDSSLIQSQTCPLLLIEKNNQIKFQIKENWNWWLYISDNPCGNASIYQRISPQRSFTGKKLRTVERSKDESNEKNENNESSQLLVTIKPGRIDIEECRRSSSMSCSDKICRWSCLGLQGFK